MRKNKEEKKNQDNKKSRLALETASSRLAEIFIAQIEFSRNKNKNVYEKRK